MITILPFWSHFNKIPTPLSCKVLLTTFQGDLLTYSFIRGRVGLQDFDLVRMVKLQNFHNVMPEIGTKITVLEDFGRNFEKLN